MVSEDNSLKVCLVAAAAAFSVCSVGVASAATMTIDDFTDAQNVAAMALSPSFPSSSEVLGAGILGGARDLSVTTSATGPLQTQGSVAAGTLGFSNTVGVSGSLTATWDGTGTPGSGLGYDFTGGGLFSSVVVDLLSSDTGLSMSLIVDGDTVTKVFATGVASVSTQMFDFSEFASADFSNVNSLSLFLTGPEDLDASISLVGLYGADTTAVPLPAAGLPLLAGIAALGAIGRRRRRAA